jgi:hypothetical protein
VNPSQASNAPAVALGRGGGVRTPGAYTYGRQAAVVHAAPRCRPARP